MFHRETCLMICGLSFCSFFVQRFGFQQAPIRFADYKKGAGGRWAQPLLYNLIKLYRINYFFQLCYDPCSFSKICFTTNDMCAFIFIFYMCRINKKNALHFCEDLSNLQPVNSDLQPFRAFLDDVGTRTTLAELLRI